LPQICLLALSLAAALYWALTTGAPPVGASHPVTAVFAALTIWIGLPFLTLGATGPLMQAWWARAEASPIPWKLYALSNLASLLALACYPALIEPALTLRAQRWLWTAGFVLFAALSGVLAWRMRTVAPPRQAIYDTKDNAPAAPLGHKLLWLLLPMGASMQLCAVTSHLTENIAPIPLLWVLPLGVYLITLILAFEFPRLAQRALVSRFLLVLLAGLAYMLTQSNESLPMRMAIAFYLAELFFACYFLHAAAYALRPQRKSEATLYYLVFAAGGALGSMLIGIAAPLIFRFNFDIAITFLVTALLALAATWRDGWNNRLIWVACSIMMGVLVGWLHIASQRDTVVAVRNFYGSLRVKQDLYNFPGATLRTLSNGNIQHGTQIFGTDEERKTPTTYYGPDSGIGIALRNCCAQQPRRIGVIGLGTGTLAAYGRPGDVIRFYEINPAVEPLARNVFTYIRESQAHVDIVEGDARLELVSEPPQRFDVIVIDAFTGDAIPLHLLTTEAMALYRKHLAPGGVLAFHISNQHVELEGPIALLAQSSGMKARRVNSLPDDKLDLFGSSWLLVTDNNAFLTLPDVAVHSHPATLASGLRVWTDDYSSLLPVLHW
jgi:hypothetical protein